VEMVLVVRCVFNDCFLYVGGDIDMKPSKPVNYDRLFEQLESLVHRAHAMRQTAIVDDDFTEQIQRFDLEVGRAERLLQEVRRGE